MSRRRHVLLAVALVSSSLPGLVAQRRGQAAPPSAETRAEPPAEGAKITFGKDGFVLPEGDVMPDELVNAAARFLSRNILVQPQELANLGVFTFQHRLALDAVGCEELLCELLASRGAALVPIDEQKQVYEVINLLGQRRGEAWSRPVWRTPEEVLRRPNLRQLVVTSVQLQHINAMVATNALRPFFASGNSNNAVGLSFGMGATNESLLLLGFADQVAGAVRLLQQSDRPLKERSPEMYEWQQTVQSLQNSITDLQTRLATAQKQIAELQKASTEGRK
jgi:hypothetical protein